MIKDKKLDNLIDETAIYLIKEYGLHWMHSLEKIMRSPYTQELYDGVKPIPNCTAERLGEFYMGKLGEINL